jgi:hypothetical protein
VWDQDWLKLHRFRAREGLKNKGLWGKTGFTEFQFALADSPINKAQSELLQATEQAQINAFGWPIGVVLHGDGRPKPVSDGIVAEIPSAGSYDYWTLRRNGDFYLLQTLFEDRRRPQHIFFDTRIVRITEALLYSARLYSRLGVAGGAVVHFGVRHVGLKGRLLSGSGSSDWGTRSPVEDEVYTEMTFSLSNVDSSIVELTKKLLQPLFELFDFFRVPDDTYDTIVNEFVKKSTH